MAARIFTSAGVNNLWSNAANWDGGVSVPIDGDSVTIPIGETCEFDVDQSAFVDGIAGITITGTLKLTRTPGTYYMKIKAANTISGAGTFDCGTDGDEIPFAAKHTITGGAGWYINGSGGLTMTVYAAEPTYTYVKLSGAEAAGQTVLSVDTDVTGDIWQAGDEISICNINKGQDQETRTIAAGGIAASEITITAGLTKAKLEGALVILISRNIKFIGVGATGCVAQYLASGKLIVASGQWTTANYQVFYSCTDMVISGGTFSGNTFVLYFCTGVSISGGMFSGNSHGMRSCPGASISDGVFSGNSYGLRSCIGASISGGVFSGNGQGLNVCIGASISGGTFSGNTFVLYFCTDVSISDGVFSGNSYGMHSSSATIKNAAFTFNEYDTYLSIFDGYGITLTSTPQNDGYQSFPREIYSYIVDNGEVRGAYKSWTKGGVTEKQSVVYPTGYDESYQIALENADYEDYFQRELVVGAGQSVNFDLWLRKDGAMTYLPRFQIFLKRQTDPFAGGTPEHTFTMTNSVDTWENESYTYSNGGTEDETLVVRCLGKAASGNVYGMYNAEILNVDLTQVLADLATINGIVNDVLVDTGTDIPALLAVVQADLDDPSQYKADVSALALEATLTAIKGAGWTSETLKTIYDTLGTVGLSAEEVRDAVGLANANLDTQFLNLVEWAAVNIDASVTEGQIIQIRGNTWDFDITGVTLDANKQQFYVKQSPVDDDAEALLGIDSDAGLLVLNGSSEVTAGNASLTYDAGTGTLHVHVEAVETAKLPAGNWKYGIQGVGTTGIVSENYKGDYKILADIVRTTT